MSLDLFLAAIDKVTVATNEVLSYEKTIRGKEGEKMHIRKESQIGDIN